jgi:hypothetical protein
MLTHGRHSLCPSRNLTASGRADQHTSHGAHAHVHMLPHSEDPKRRGACSNTTTARLRRVAGADGCLLASRAQGCASNTIVGRIYLHRPGATPIVQTGRRVADGNIALDADGARPAAIMAAEMLHSTALAARTIGMRLDGPPHLVRSGSVCARRLSHHQAYPITRMQVHAPESLALTAVSSLAVSNAPVRASDLNQRPGVFHNQPWPPPKLGRCKTSCHYLCVSFHTFALLIFSPAKCFAVSLTLFSPPVRRFHLPFKSLVFLFFYCRRTASSATTGSIYYTKALSIAFPDFLLPIHLPQVELFSHTGVV